MDTFVSVVTLLILVLQFFYQFNRSRLLEQRLEQQQKLLEGMQSVSTQFSTLIQQQSTVLSSALKYAESFDAEKLTKRVRDDLQREHLSVSEEVVREVMRVTFVEITKLFAQPIRFFVAHLYMLPPAEREKVL